MYRASKCAQPLQHRQQFKVNVQDAETRKLPEILLKVSISQIKWGWSHSQFPT